MPEEFHMAVIYARYSSDKQNETSIEAQVRACQDYAQTHNMKIVGQYADEAISGKGSKTAARRQYQKMLRDCDKGLFDTILIHQYDRIARNLGEHVNLETRLKSKGVQLIAVAQDFGTGKEAKIMRALMWSLSEYYIDNLAAETRKGLKETALKGQHTGGVSPFGYDIVNKQYVINELEAGYVRRMFDAAANRQGFTQIIEEMAAAGITGKRGRPIKYPSIYEILRNEKYTGTFVYSPEEETRRTERRSKPNAIRIENALPTIISKAQFMEVQRIMNARKQTGKKSNYLCSGLVYCQCGAKMHAQKSVRKGHEYHYYICSKKCGAPAVRMEEVDAAAIRYLHDLLSDKNQKRIADALRDYQAGEGCRMEEFNSALQVRITAKQNEYTALLKNLSSAALPPEVVQDIGEQMQAIKTEIATLEQAEPPKDFTVDTIKSWLNSLKAVPDEKAIHLLIERIDIVGSGGSDDDFHITSTLKTILGENGCPPPQPLKSTDSVRIGAFSLLFRHLQIFVRYQKRTFGAHAKNEGICPRFLCLQQIACAKAFRQIFARLEISHLVIIAQHIVQPGAVYREKCLDHVVFVRQILDQTRVYLANRPHIRDGIPTVLDVVKASRLQLAVLDRVFRHLFQWLTVQYICILINPLDLIPPHRGNHRAAPLPELAANAFDQAAGEKQAAVISFAHRPDSSFQISGVAGPFPYGS